MNEHVFKLIKWFLIISFITAIPVYFLIFSKTRAPKKILNKIDKAIEKNDFVKAHEFLNEYAVMCKEEGGAFGIGFSMIYGGYTKDYYPIAQKVYSAEIRYLVSLDTDASWNKAYMLPKEVDKSDLSECKKLQQTLYDELLDYANEFEREDIADRITKVKNREESTEEGN